MSKKVTMNDPRKMSYSPDVNLPPPLAESESALTTLGSEVKILIFSTIIFYSNLELVVVIIV